MLKSIWRCWKINYIGKDDIMETSEILKMFLNASLTYIKVLGNVFELALE